MVKPVVSGPVFIDGEASEGVVILRDSLVGALGYHAAIQWKTPDLSLPPPNIAAVDEALAHVEKAQEFGKEGEVEKGLQELLSAVKILDENIYTLCTATPKAIGKYINVLRRLSVFQFFSEDKAGAESTLWRLFALHPAIEFKKFTKELKPMFLKVQKEHAAKGMTVLDVTTDPPGAKVYYNFELQGPSPAKVEEVPAGEAILLAVMPGYEPKVERVAVTPPAEGSVPVSIRLTPVPLMQTLLPLREEMDAAAASEPILQAARALSADIVLVMRMDVRGPREVVVRGVLFDSRSKVRLSERRVTLDPQTSTPQQVRAYVASLFDGVRLDGRTEQEKPKVKKDGLGSGFWVSVSRLPQKKYFWPVVGGVAGAIVVGAIVGAVLLQGENLDEYHRTTGSKVVLGF